MAIARYKLKLKKVSGAALRLLDAVYNFLPNTQIREKFRGEIEAALARHLGADTVVRLEAVRLERFSNYVASLPDPFVCAVLGMAPTEKKMLCELDASLASSVVERMLGGQPAQVQEPRVPSDTEQGVVQYLLMELLAAIHKMSGRDARLHFRFDRFAFHRDQISDVVSPEDGVAVLVFRVEMGKISGFARLVLPDPFVEETMLNVEAPHEQRDGESGFVRKQLSRFNFVKTHLWAEAGRATLMLDDLRQIEEGDVIIFDSTDMMMADGRPQGRVILRIGDGLSGGIDAELELAGARARCRMIGIHEGE